MVAAGQFRHHPAILGMQRDLRIQRVRQQAAAGLVNGHPGFVAGAFNAQYGTLQGGL
jgi:hypothetical protein